MPFGTGPKSRDRVSVHVNFPPQLCELKAVKNGSGDSPEGKGLGKFASACLKV